MLEVDVDNVDPEGNESVWSCGRVRWRNWLRLLNEIDRSLAVVGRPAAWRWIQGQINTLAPHTVPKCVSYGRPGQWAAYEMTPMKAMLAILVSPKNSCLWLWKPPKTLKKFVCFIKTRLGKQEFMVCRCLQSNVKALWGSCQRIVTNGGRITVRLVSNLTRLDLTK